MEESGGREGWGRQGDAVETADCEAEAVEIRV